METDIPPSSPPPRYPNVTQPPMAPNDSCESLNGNRTQRTPRADAVARESSITTDGSPRPFDIQELTNEDVSNIWSKLRDCSFGDGKLDSDDAYEILCLISSLVRADVTKTFDEVSESFVSIIGHDIASSIDEDNLRHLVTAYSKLATAEAEPVSESEQLATEAAESEKAKKLNVATTEQDGNEVALVQLAGQSSLTSSKFSIDTSKPTHRDNSAQNGEFHSPTRSGLNSEDQLLLERLRLSGEAVLLLGHIRDWNFDIFALQQLTPYPLVAVAETALNEMNLTFSMELGIMKLRRFLVDIADAYLPNAYHNQLHAADVTQTMYHFLSTCRLGHILGLNNLAILAMLVSAAVHDVAHPGVTGKYLIAVGDPLAIQYNDSSPLENMHLATAFNCLARPENNFLDKFSKTVYREFRRISIEMVLSTDNDRHFTLMEKVESLISSGEAIMSNPTPMKSHTPRLSKTRSAFVFSNLHSPTAAGSSGISNINSTLSPSSDSTSTNTSINALSSATGAGSAASDGLHVHSHASKRRNSDAGGVSFNIPIDDKLAHSPLILTRDRVADDHHSPQVSDPTPHASTPGASGRSQSARVITTRDPSPLMLSPHNNSSLTRPRNSTVTNLNPLLCINTTNNARTVASPSSSNTNTTVTEARQLLLMQLALHAADVSNPAKPWEQHLTWYPRLMEEFFSQGDKERELNYPITYAFDRNNSVPQAKFQIGFLKAIVGPLYKSFARIPYLNISHCLASMERNVANWEVIAASEYGDGLRDPNQVAAIASKLGLSSHS